MLPYKQLIKSTSELIETRLISSTVSDRKLTAHALMATTSVNGFHFTRGCTSLTKRAK